MPTPPPATPAWALRGSYAGQLVRQLVGDKFHRARRQIDPSLKFLRRAGHPVGVKGVALVTDGRSAGLTLKLDLEQELLPNGQPGRNAAGVWAVATAQRLPSKDELALPRHAERIPRLAPTTVGRPIVSASTPVRRSRAVPGAFGGVVSGRQGPVAVARDSLAKCGAVAMDGGQHSAVFAMRLGLREAERIIARRYRRNLKRFGKKIAKRRRRADRRDYQRSVSGSHAHAAKGARRSAQLLKGQFDRDEQAVRKHNKLAERCARRAGRPVPEPRLSIRERHALLKGAALIDGAPASAAIAYTRQQWAPQRRRLATAYNRGGKVGKRRVRTDGIRDSYEAALADFLTWTIGPTRFYGRRLVQRASHDARRTLTRLAERRERLELETEDADIQRRRCPPRTLSFGPAWTRTPGQRLRRKPRFVALDADQRGRHAKGHAPQLSVGLGLALGRQGHSCWLVNARNTSASDGRATHDWFKTAERGARRWQDKGFVDATNVPTRSRKVVGVREKLPRRGTEPVVRRYHRQLHGKRWWIKRGDGTLHKASECRGNRSKYLDTHRAKAASTRIWPSRTSTGSRVRVRTPQHGLQWVLALDKRDRDANACPNILAAAAVPIYSHGQTSPGFNKRWHQPYVGKRLAAQLGYPSRARWRHPVKRLRLFAGSDL